MKNVLNDEEFSHHSPHWCLTFHSQEGTCHYNPSQSGATDVGYTDLPQGDENALKEASATTGPISIAIDASQPSFQLYKTGVYTMDRKIILHYELTVIDVPWLFLAL